MIHFDLPKEKSSIIKVIGIGGGGSNAVNHMFNQNIAGVDFVICNTDAQALHSSAVPNKVQLGPHLTQGLGAGANPTIGKQATEESFDEIKKILEVNTKMAFITAGMGGGTGTGGAPIIAKICRELGILTVGIVTMPFSYEGKKRMQQAEEGINALNAYVDTLLIISNDKLRHQFGNLPFKTAFAKADNILATAAKCITDVINQHGHINVDFADVCTAMRNGGVAILGAGLEEGENRAQKAIEQALASPLLNDNNIKGAKWILLNITSSEGTFEHTIDEMDVMQAYVQSQAGDDCDVILGAGYDNSLGEKLGVTVIATGFDQSPFSATVKKEQTSKKEEAKITMQLASAGENNPGEIKEVKVQESESMAPHLAEKKWPAENSGEGSGRESRIRITLPQTSKPKEEHTEPEPNGNQSGGYLTRPAHIYMESESQPADDSSKEDQINDMKLVIRTPSMEAGKGSGHKNSPINLEETDEQKLKAAERLTKLRTLSFNVKAVENNPEMENVPAYMRKNITLDSEPKSTDSVFSAYSIGEPRSGGPAEISSINTFLDGKKPD
jgi:cell division protein FtsZ